MKRPTGAMAMAYMVAKGERKLADLPKPLQNQVTRIMTAYGGEQAVKDLATYKAPEVKIGRRATTYRHARTA